MYKHTYCVCVHITAGATSSHQAHINIVDAECLRCDIRTVLSRWGVCVCVYVCIYVVVFVIAPVFDYNLTWQNVNLNIGINFIHLRTLILSCGGRVRVCVGVCWCVCERAWRSDVEQRDGMERSGRRFSGECVCVHTHTWGVETRCFVCELWCWWWRCLVRNDDFSTSNVCVCTRMPNCEMILNNNKKGKEECSPAYYITWVSGCVWAMMCSYTLVCVCRYENVCVRCVCRAMCRVALLRNGFRVFRYSICTHELCVHHAIDLYQYTH